MEKNIYIEYRLNEKFVYSQSIINIQDNIGHIKIKIRLDI